MRVHRQAATLNALQAALPSIYFKLSQKSKQRGQQKEQCSCDCHHSSQSPDFLKHPRICLPRDALLQLTQTICVQLDHQYSF